MMRERVADLASLDLVLLTLDTYLTRAGSNMQRKQKKLTVEQELAVLRFWAQGIDIARTFTQAEVASVDGLAAAINAVASLPAALGWDEEEPRQAVSRRARPVQH